MAKRVTGESGLTATGQVLGTPSFMPPEQASGQLDKVQETADVYSLGATLYALLAGRPPFQADNPLDTLVQVVHSEPVSLRQLNSKLPRDLETICQKCLQKEPRRRYASADELRRYLDGKPIHARPIGPATRTWRWCKRNKVLTFWIGAFIASMLYPLVLGIFTMLGFGTFVGLSWSSSKDRPHDARGISWGRVNKDGMLVLSGIKADRFSEAEEILEWTSLYTEVQPTVFRFTSGPSESLSDTFHAGGYLKVWIELEKEDEVRRFHEFVVDLTADPADSMSGEATFAFLRFPWKEKGTETWLYHVGQYRCLLSEAEANVRLISPIADSDLQIGSKYRSTSERYHGEVDTNVPVWSEPPLLTDAELLALATNREDTSAEERAAFEKEFTGSDTKFRRLGRQASSAVHTTDGLLTKPGVDHCLHVITAGYGLTLDRIRLRYDLPTRDEKPDFTIRVMCRLLTDDEVAEWPSHIIHPRS